MEVDRYATADTCKLLIGNKCDRSDRVVSEAEGQALARELGMPFLETSARTAENVEAAFIRMAEQLITMRYVPGWCHSPCWLHRPLHPHTHSIRSFYVCRAAARTENAVNLHPPTQQEGSAQRSGCC